MSLSFRLSNQKRPDNKPNRSRKYFVHNSMILLCLQSVPTCLVFIRCAAPFISLWQILSDIWDYPKIYTFREKTQTCKQKYASARHIHAGGIKKEKNTARRNMFSPVCALSINSRLCIKMSYLLFVRTWAMPRILYLSCGIPFPV